MNAINRNYDGTGPEGEGPMTGRGRGWCPTCISLDDPRDTLPNWALALISLGATAGFMILVSSKKVLDKII